MSAAAFVGTAGCGDRSATERFVRCLQRSGWRQVTKPTAIADAHRSQRLVASWNNPGPFAYAEAAATRPPGQFAVLAVGRNVMQLRGRDALLRAAQQRPTAFDTVLVWRSAQETQSPSRCEFSVVPHDTP